VLAAADVQVTLLNRDASARAQAAIVPRDNQGATLVAEAETGVVFTPHEFEAAAAAIEKLLADVELRWRYGENGRRCAEERLSTDVVLSRCEELFERVIAG
jgi:glycosyltransferase involved in cell wall biosynthesis